MRQSKREITDRQEQLEILHHSDVCRLALNDDGYPYIIPLNFGLQVSGDRVTLLFHSAVEGYKLDLIRQDNRASFEVDGSHQLQYFEEKGYCTMAYESVVGRGRIRMLEPEEKAEALATIMEHYHPGQHAGFNPDAIPRTTVYALDVEQMTGKRKLPK